ncbi:MHS family MFS transporter [Microbacterium sp. KUDC0406]|uniref:MFS transporter n=1 Tax=Microbacterium sp. KUDC0406 TaxID=2909588 RepID=UPI001F377F09|nr:MFS transporter [Microbacterium sp. KUDC0406]UJP08772.1 MHS family MFS transporter [Microbacterium sp. KUDC0406]
MSDSDQDGFTPTGTIASPGDRRRVVFATVVGTTVEWYDFFIYAFAAATVFATLFFQPMGEDFAQIVSFFTVGVSFLFRPLGAFLAGHFGDKIGRRPMLVLTLLLMGASTTLVGLLPTHAVIGVWAPILLIFLRIVQGISAGGEWGGAVLMAVEHAPKKKRGVFGASPQIGVPIGLLLASMMLALMAQIAPGDAFLAWGWRVPFLLSFVLILVGYWVRRRVEESPVFTEIAERKEETRMPIVQLFRRHALLVIVAALVFAGNNAVGYMTTGGYVQRYATDPKGPIALDTAPVFWVVALSGVTWLVFTWLGGWLSDRIGRRNTYILGWILQLVGVFLLFPMTNAGTVWSLALALIILTVGLGFTYGPQAALYSELFPASIRFSGVSISYAIGAILGGAFSPLIAQAIFQNTGSTVGITWYLAGMTLIGLAATLLLRDRSGIPLGPDFEAEQEKSPIYGLSKA